MRGPASHQQLDRVKAEKQPRGRLPLQNRSDLALCGCVPKPGKKKGPPRKVLDREKLRPPLRERENETNGRSWERETRDLLLPLGGHGGGGGVRAGELGGGVVVVVW